MGVCARSGCAFLAAVVLAGCSNMPLTAEDRAALCRAGVTTEPDAFAFRSNPAYSAAGGPAIGMGVGTLALFTVLLPLAPLMVVKGIECGIASAKYPNAETEFARIFDTVDRASLQRGIRAALAAGSDPCGKGDGDRAVSGAPPAVIRIEHVVGQIACSTDKLTYGITVTWQATAGAGTRTLRSAATHCLHASPVDAGAWAADADRARAEIERALASTGQRIVLELLATDNLFACQYPPLEGDASSPR